MPNCVECGDLMPKERPNRFDGYIWETRENSWVYICPKCVCRILGEYFDKKGIFIAQTIVPVQPVVPVQNVRKLEFRE